MIVPILTSGVSRAVASPAARLWRGLGIALLLALSLGSSLNAVAAGRHVSIIVDTSGSMDGNDKPRYTLQLSQIIADLLEPGDSLTVIRMPKSESRCSDGPDPALALSLNPADRGGFQAKLDTLLKFDTGTYFAAPVHTAQADLDRHSNEDRLLLFIADSGGLGNCASELTEDLKKLHGQGVMIAAINLGGEGAFDGNPAFDLTTGASDSEKLAKSVAGVYQKFIGAKEVQTGRVGATIEIELGPLVKDAYLVVAADGQLSGMEAVKGNPKAGQVDLNHKGGGHAVGLDKRQRDYRIVRLHRPEAGVWRFRASGLKDTAGWMLLQDSALALRLASTPKAAQDISAPLEIELYDQDTGKRLATSPGGLQASVEAEGQKIELRDDGQDGDRKAGDGVFTAPVKFNQAGKQRIRINLQSKLLDRHTEVEIEVEKVGWTLQADAPSQAELDTPANLSVQARPAPTSLSPAPVQTIEVYVDGKVQASLRDDGKNGDAQAGDNRYSGQWTPQAIGERNLEFRPVGGSRAQPVAATVKVVGSIRFGAPVPVKLGRTGSNSQLQGRLELGAGTVVKGEFTLDLNSAYHASGSSLEIDLGEGWVALDGHARPVSLNSKGPSSWPLRLRVGDCPAGVTAADRFTIEFAGADANGQPVRHSVPIELAITEDPWLHCWWPVLAAAAAALLTGIVIYGFWSPSRFSAKLGVVLSPEEDMNEGFFHPIRAQRGSGSGFYRDARVYIRPDFRLSARAKGELARLRADGRRVCIRPATAATVYRQNFDGAWEALPSGETTVHFGVAYKDSMGGVYFELRNG